MAASVGNIRIEPVDVTWQIEEQWQVTTVADVSSSLNSKYFIIYSGSNAKFYVWIDINNTGVDPAISGATGISAEVSAANATAAQVAAAINTAVNANANFTSTVSGNVVTITADLAGDTDVWEDGAAPTGFTLVQCQEGGSIDLGFLDGDVEIAFEENLFEVTAHQTGLTKLADLRQGVSAEITLTLKECDAANLKEIFAKGAGGVHTPSGGTEVFGWGKSRQGLNTIIQSRRLIFHPVALAGSNYTRDICFWKAYPMPDTLVYSGENPQTLGITFKTYLDDAKPSEIQQWVYGDWTQYVPVYP